MQGNYMAIQKTYISMQKELSLLGLYICFHCNEVENLEKCSSTEDQKLRNVYICSCCSGNLEDVIYNTERTSLKSPPYR